MSMTDLILGTWHKYEQTISRCGVCDSPRVWTLLTPCASSWCDKCRKEIAEPQLVNGGNES